MDNISVPSDCVIATFIPMYKSSEEIVPKIREYPKEGQLTKSGALDKRDSAGTWDMIREKVHAIITDYDDFISNTEDVPEPEFGECALCPYHNTEVEFGGQKYFCNG